LAIAIIGCGGGSSSSESDIGPQGGDPSKLNGIWVGYYGDEDIGIILLLKDSEIYAGDGKGITYFGNYTYSNTGEFASTISNSNVDIQISGTAAAQDKIEATYTSSNGNKGNTTLNFSQNYYNRASAFELLTDQWSYDQSAYSIDPAGSLSGTYNGRCEITGAFSIIDPEKNLYMLDADLTQCDIEGQYNGLVFLYETDTVQNSKFFGVIANDQTKQCVGLYGERQQ
jgi:hypothetical protein